MNKVNYVSANKIIELIEDYKKELNSMVETIDDYSAKAQMYALSALLNDIYDEDDRLKRAGIGVDDVKCEDVVKVIPKRSLIREITKIKYDMEQQLLDLVQDVDSTIEDLTVKIEKLTDSISEWEK